MMVSIFSYVSRPSVCPPWGTSVQVLCPFFNWVVFLPGVEVCEFFIYFAYQTLVLGTIGKYVLPYSWFSFQFNAVFFSHTEVFYWMRSHLFILSFMSLALGDVSVKILLYGISEIFMPMFCFRTFMVSQLIFKSYPPWIYFCVWCK